MTTGAVNEERKQRMMSYAKRHKLPIPNGFNAGNGAFGQFAQRLLMEIEAHLHLPIGVAQREDVVRFFVAGVAIEGEMVRAFHHMRGVVAHLRIAGGGLVCFGRFHAA